MADEGRDIWNVRVVELLEDAAFLLDPGVVRPPRVLQPHEFSGSTVQRDEALGPSCCHALFAKVRFGDQERARLATEAGHFEAVATPSRDKGISETSPHVSEDGGVVDGTALGDDVRFVVVEVTFVGFCCSVHTIVQYRTWQDTLHCRVESELL